MPQVQGTTTTIAVKTLPLNKKWIAILSFFFAINITSRLFCQMYRQTHTEENSSSSFFTSLIKSEDRHFHV